MRCEICEVEPATFGNTICSSCRRFQYGLEVLDADKRKRKRKANGLLVVCCALVVAVLVGIFVWRVI